MAREDVVPGGPGGLTTAPALVGREHELGMLRQALHQPPAVALVAGEAGVGKSRLVREALVNRPAHLARALVAVCPPLRESLTLGPVVDALRDACPDGPHGLSLSPLAGALRPLFPEWADELPGAPEPAPDATAARHRLLRALVELLDALQVTTLVVEDAHWADETTGELLLSVAARLRADQCLLVTYRPAELAAHASIRRLPARSPHGTRQERIELSGLDLAATSTMMSALLGGGPVATSLARFVHDHTGGLPLAVEESARLLRERHQLVRRAGEWSHHPTAELRVPPTVRDSALERLEALSPAARRVAEVAAVVGEPVDGEFLVQVADPADSADGAALLEALSSGLLVEAPRGRIAIRHVLLIRAIYDAIPAPRRRWWHRAAGAALEDAGSASAGQLARHFREAGETGKWRRYGEHAAALALASGDNTKAVLLLNELLTHPNPSPADRARLARTLAFALLRRRETVDHLHQQVVSTLRAVLAAGGIGAREEAEIRNPLGRLLMQLGDYEAGRAELERAIPHLAHDSLEAARAMTYLGMPLVGPWPVTRQLPWLRRATALDTTGIAEADRLGLVADLAFSFLLLGDERGWELGAEFEQRTSTSAAERNQLARGREVMSHAAMVWGSYRHAARLLADALELVEGDHRHIWSSVAVMRAYLDWLTGTWEALEDQLAEWLEPGAGGSTLARLRALIIAGQLDAARGDADRAAARLETAVAEAGTLGVVDDLIEAGAALGRVRLSQQRVNDALAVTDRAIETVTTKRVWMLGTEVVPVRVRALMSAGQAETAHRLVSAFARALRGCRAPAPRAALAACRAVLAAGRGDDGRAAAAFARAAAAWERLPRPYEALLAREQQCVHLLRAGRIADGVPLLSQAFRELAELGAYEDADRIAGHLRAHGSGVRLPWRGGRRGYGDELSPRELEVVRLVVAGQTNAQIARSLSRSPKTVGTQLNSAMRKLRVSSRTELAVTAIEANLVPRRASDAA